MRKVCAFVVVALVAAGCGDGDSDDGGGAGGAGGAGGSGGNAPLVTVSGHAFNFEGPRIAGGTVTWLETGRSTTTAEDGAFSFDAVPADADVTLELAAEGFTPIQTATHVPGVGGMERLTFQAVTPTMHDLLAGVVGITPDPARCQLVTTITRVGKSLYDAGAHGEAGATVTIEPPVPEGSGPIYFNASVIPDRALVESSDDGGVLFTNVPTGSYVLRAQKEGVTFREVRMRCRAGLLVNASPPWGLQRL